MRSSILILSVVVALPIATSQVVAQAVLEPSSAVVVNAATIAKFSPRARADLVAAIETQWQAALKADITAPLRVQHFMAQIATESGGLRIIEENLNYSAERLLEIFPTRVTPEDAQRLALKPVDIANHVYNGRFKNNPPMDGWTYRGSGLIQLTGRSNFAERGGELKLPLETEPDLARKAPTAFTTAVSFWSARHINLAADADDVVEVRRLVNGGKNGLSEARIWLSRAKQTFGAAAREKSADSLEAEELAAVQDRLSDLNFLDMSKSAGPSRVEEALRSFQKSRGLPPTGLYDEDTLYELTNPENVRRDNSR